MSEQEQRTGMRMQPSSSMPTMFEAMLVAEFSDIDDRLEAMVKLPAVPMSGTRVAVYDSESQHEEMLFVEYSVMFTEDCSLEVRISTDGFTPETLGRIFDAAGRGDTQ